MQLDEQSRFKSGRELADVNGQLVTCGLDELHPHPSYVRHHLTVPASQLSSLAARGDFAFQEPLVITQDRTIVDGYARAELARLQGRVTLPCIEYKLTETEALYWLLHRHRRSNGFNDFNRILLALELEPSLREKARTNQRVGGQNKGSSKLTEAERLDVRSEVAAAAGVSVGNVSKVKQLTKNVHTELLETLRSGEISIHRAWLWSNESLQKQREALWTFQSMRAVRKVSKRLVLRHQRDRRENSPTIPNVADLLRFLSELQRSERSEIGVATVKAPGKAIFLTEELVQSFRPYQESIPTCATKIR